MQAFLLKAARLAVLLTLIASTLLVPQTAKAATVSCADPCGSAALNEAIAAAGNGDTIDLPSGTYTLDTLVTVNKNVTLNGTGSTIFQVSGTGPRISFTTPGATLQNVEILKTDKTGGQNIIYIAANNVTLSHLTVHGQYVKGDGEVARAIEVTGGLTGIVIENSTIYALRQPGYLNGSQLTIRDNLVYGTRGWVLANADVTFTGNEWGSGTQRNAVDIAIIPGTSASLYTDLMALSAANGGAVIEDQRSTPFLLTHAWVDDSAAAGGNGYPISPYQSVQAGINRVIPGGVVYVAAGTYLENNAGWNDLAITKPLTLTGAGKSQTIIKLTEGKPNGVEINGSGLNVVIEGMTFTRRDGSTYGPAFGLRIAETASSFTGFTLRDVDVSYMQGRNVQFGAAGTYTGIIIANSEFHHAGSWGLSVDGPTDGLYIDNSTFNDNGSADASKGIGLDIGNGGITNVQVTNSDFSRNTMKGINLVKTTHAMFDDIVVSNTGPAAENTGISLWEWGGGASSDITIKNSQFRDNSRMAILLGTEAGNTISNVSIFGNLFLQNGMGAVFNWGEGTLSGVTAHHNSIVNSGDGIYTNQPQFEIKAENNWWGCNEGPTHAHCTKVSTGVDASPWLVLTVTPENASVQPGGSTPVTASLNTNSSAVDTSDGGIFIFPRAVAFLADTGAVAPQMGDTLDGEVATAYTAVKADGAAPVCAALDNETTCADVTVANIAPAAEGETYTMDQRTKLTVAAPGLLSNDSDANETALTAVLVDDAAHGKLELAADGSFVYEPDAAFFGADTFTYRVSDGKLTSSLVTVTITVNTDLTKQIFLPVVMR